VTSKAASNPRVGGKPAAKSTALLRWSRHLHTWFGVVIGIFLIVEALTAIYLVHDKSLQGLGSAQLDVGWLPDHYEVGGAAPRLTAVAVDPSRPGRLIAGTRAGLFESVDGGRTFACLGGGTSGFEAQALLFVDGSLYVGTKKSGLLRCDARGAACDRVGGWHDVESLASSGDRLLVAAHRQGAFVYEPRSGKRTAIAKKLMSLEAAMNEKGDVHVTSLLEGSGDGEWLVGTKEGLFRGSDAAGFTREPIEDGEIVALAAIGDRRLALVSGSEGGSVLAPLWEHDATLGWRPASVDRAGADASVDGTALFVAGGGVVTSTADRRAQLVALAPLPVSTVRSVALGKVLEDIHTGEFFGGNAWWLYDLIALSLIGFVATGIYLWIVPILRRRKKRKATGGVSTAAPAAPRPVESE
jgi:hypothetical protein